MRFDVCIFDLDGTLVDTSGDITNAVNDMLNFFHLDMKDKDEVISYVGDGIRKLVERCIVNQDVDLEKAESIFIEAYSSRIVETTKPYPGIMDVLDYMMNRCIAILTNKSYRFTKQITDALGLTNYFPVILGGDTLEKKKPDPCGVEYILNYFKIPKEHAVLIGDGKNDVLSAKNAGIASIYVTYGYTHRDSLKDYNPDFIVDHPTELLNI